MKNVLWGVVSLFIIGVAWCFFGLHDLLIGGDYETEDTDTR